MSIDILKSEGLSPPGQGEGKQASSSIDILQSEGIAPPPQKVPEGNADQALEILKRHPIINAGVQAGQTIGQALDNAINFAAKGGRKIEEFAGIQPSGAPLNLQAPKVAQPGTSAEVGKLLGGGAILGLGGEAAGAAKIGEAIAGAGKVLPGMIERAVGGAAVAPTLAPKHPVKAALETLAMSPVADVATLGVGKAIGKGISAVKNKKAIVQNVLRNFFSKDAAPFIKNKLDGIMTDLRGSSSKATSNSDLFNRLNTHYEELGKDNSLRGPDDVPNTYVQPGNSVGDAYARVPVNLPADESIIKNKITGQIKSLQDEMAPFSATVRAKKGYQDAINILEDYKKTKINTVGDAERLKEAINNDLRDKDLPIKVRGPLMALRDTAIKGEKGAISVGAGKSDPQAAALLREADSRYKNEMVPFQQVTKKTPSQFWNVKGGKATTDKFGSAYLKPGSKQDQQELLDNFLKIAPPDEGATRKLLAYDYFKNVEDNPAEIVKTWSKLGEGQKEKLLPEYKDDLDQLAKLQKKYPSSFKETAREGLGKQLKGAAKIGSGLMLATHGHLALGALPFIIPSLASSAARSAFENPEVQKTFIEELANKGLIGKGEIPIGVHYLRNILASVPTTKLKSEGK